MGLPYNKRRFRSFLSAAYADSKFVGQIESWLSNKAGVSVLYSTGVIPSESSGAADLERALGFCQSMLIVLTRRAVESGWVRFQFEAGLKQRDQAGRAFSIVPIRIEECDLPDFLQHTRWVDMSVNGFDLVSASELLQNLYPADPGFEGSHGHDIFVTHPWRNRESVLFDMLCDTAGGFGFRLVGNPAGSNVGMNRARKVIAGCGGMAAVLSDAFDKEVRKQITEEVELALSLNLPCVLAVDGSVRLPRTIINNAFAVLTVSEGDYQNQAGLKQKIHALLSRLQDEWVAPPNPPYIFYGTDLKVEHKHRNHMLRRFIQRIALMPCQVGDEIQHGQVQQEIVHLIMNAYMMVADVSQENLNTCIEAGIGIGAGVPVHLVSDDVRHKPPFMFRDRQIWHYESDMDLLGIVHRLILPYRRTIF